MKKLSAQEIQNRLDVVHNKNVILDTDSYVNMGTKCKFIDSLYGEWSANPNNVLNKKTSHPKRTEEKKVSSFLKKYGVTNPFFSREIQSKRTKTLIDRYGVDNPQKVSSISLKTAKTKNKISIRYHWKTGEELNCQGSWEAKVVDWLNKNKIDFDWQIVFQIPVDYSVKQIAGKTYRVDAYLKEHQLYIEIKGYFISEESYEKWNWFHSFHKSELWDGKKLKSLGVI